MKSLTKTTKAVSWIFACLPNDINISEAKEEDFVSYSVYDKDEDIESLLDGIYSKVERQGYYITTGICIDYLNDADKKLTIKELMYKKFLEDISWFKPRN